MLRSNTESKFQHSHWRWGAFNAGNKAQDGTRNTATGAGALYKTSKVVRTQRSACRSLSNTMATSTRRTEHLRFSATPSDLRTGHRDRGLLNNGTGLDNTASGASALDQQYRRDDSQHGSTRLFSNALGTTTRHRSSGSGVYRRQLKRHVNALFANTNGSRTTRPWVLKHLGFNYYGQ